MLSVQCIYRYIIQLCASTLLHFTRPVNVASSSSGNMILHKCQLTLSYISMYIVNLLKAYNAVLLLGKLLALKEWHMFIGWALNSLNVCVLKESESNYIVAQIASLLTLTLADSGVFHFQVHRTAHETISDVNKLINNFSGVFPNVTIGKWSSFSSQVSAWVLIINNQ